MYPLTSLEEIVMSDSNGHQVRILINQLESAVRTFSDELRQPLRPEQYASLERKQQACLAAIRVIETLWVLRPTASKKFRL